MSWLTDDVVWFPAKDLCAGCVAEGGPAFAIEPVYAFAGGIQNEFVARTQLL